MPPNRENLTMNNNNNNGSSNSSSSSSSKTRSAGSENKLVHKKQLPRLSMDSLQRTISDISLELITKQALNNHDHDNHDHDHDDHHDDFAEIQEAVGPGLEEAKCECCGMAEECTGEYVGRVRAEFGGRVVCGLCAEAVAEEMARSSGPHRGRDEALAAHVSACSRFAKLGRTHPALFQAQAFKEILKKTNTNNVYVRAKSLSPRDITYVNSKGVHGNSTASSSTSTSQRIARSSSCIPAIIRKEL